MEASLVHLTRITTVVEVNRSPGFEPRLPLARFQNGELSKRFVPESLSENLAPSCIEMLFEPHAGLSLLSFKHELGFEFLGEVSVL